MVNTRRNLFNKVVTFLLLSWTIIVNFPIASSFTPGFQASSRVTTTTTIKTPTVFQNSYTNTNTKTTTTTTTQLNVFKFTKQQQEKVVKITPPIKEESSFLTEPGFLGVWIPLLIYALALAPGEINSPDDTALIEAIIANPARPEGFNELAYFVFNIFAALPLVIAGLVVPNTRSLDESASGVTKIVRSSVPYVVGTAFIGFFALGPFLAIRPKPYDNVPTVPIEDRSWITRNIIENKLLAYGIIALLVFLPFGTNFVEAYQNDPDTVVTGFIELIQSSRFISVSIVDLLLCHIALAIYLLPIDYKARNPNATNDEIFKIAAAATLLPYLGTAIYMATRPPLPSSK